MEPVLAYSAAEAENKVYISQDEKQSQGPAFGMLLETIINKAMKRQTEEPSEDSSSEVSSTSPVTKVIPSAAAPPPGGATGSSKRKRAAPQYKPQAEREPTPPLESRDPQEGEQEQAGAKKPRVEEGAASPPASFPCVWLGDSSPAHPADPATPPAGSPGHQAAPPQESSVLNTPPTSDSEGAHAHPEPDRAPAAQLPAFPGNTINIQPQPDGGANSPIINGVATFNYPGSPAALPGSPGLPASPLEGTFDPESGSEVCPECKKVFKRKVYLQRHMEREHWSTAKVFRCDDCSYETKHQSNLSVHRRIHTGERPYHCGACGQRYTQGHLLKSHIRSRHNGDMQLYNLDKKSDSTRGRKSLDIKHDAIKTEYKNTDKISQILAQNQQKLNDILNPPPLHRGAPVPPISIPSMSAMLGAPFMAGLGGMRPGMGMTGMGPMGGLNPGGLLTTPRGFMGVPGMGGSLLGGGMGGGPMFPGFGGLGHMMGADLKPEREDLKPGVAPPLDAESAVAAATAATTGLKIPLRIPEVTQSPEKPAAPADVPEDLSVRRAEEARPAQHAQPDTQHTSAERAAAHALKTLRESLTEPGYDSGAESHGDATDSPRLDECRSPPAHAYSPCKSDCAHARKLQHLRKNVLRMLSVLTPDLNVESGVDSTSDQVDDLLHEVIYSNAAS